MLENRVDVRVIAATSRDLQQLITNGSFREDLFYRLNVIPIHLPLLRKRKEEIPHPGLELHQQVQPAIGQRRDFHIQRRHGTAQILRLARQRA
jgi:transcriptional regulator with PAS, ATPase and Fis domain